MPEDTQAVGTDAPVQDTATPQPSEANGANDATPEATQTTGETSAVKAEDTAAEDKLYAGKYKSPEDMEKAYLSLQSKSTRDSQEKAELNRILNEAFQAPPANAADTSTISQEEPDPVNQEIEGLRRVQAVQGFIMAHPDADSGTMQKILTEDPLIRQISGHEAKLEYAYLRSQNMAAPKAIEKAKAEASNQTTATIAAKQAAQVESPKSAGTPDENSSDYAKATGNYSREDRDAARLAYIRKNLINL